MGNNVFANGREVSCKAADGKAICAFPDVCFTPPENPTTPPGVPVPYPNTGMASDTTDGSKKVKISGKEVMLKNKSYFKKSIGDEAGCAAKKGVITSTIQGKVFFNSWSMDVKFEGENVVRHLDLTTHNHSSLPANAPLQLYTALAAASKSSHCADDVARVQTDCNPWEEKAKCPEELEQEIDDLLKQKPRDMAKLRQKHMDYVAEFKTNPEYKCRNSLRCILIPYKDFKNKNVGCPKETGEHLLEKSHFKGHGDYDMNAAPTAFTVGWTWHVGTHTLEHAGRTEKFTDWKEKNPGKKFTVNDYADLAAENHCEIHKDVGCNKDCVKDQIINEHDAMGVKAGDEVKKGPSIRSEEHAEEVQLELDEILSE